MWCALLSGVLGVRASLMRLRIQGGGGSLPCLAPVAAAAVIYRLRRIPSIALTPVPSLLRQPCCNSTYDVIVYNISRRALHNQVHGWNRAWALGARIDYDKTSFVTASLRKEGVPKCL